MPTSRTVIVSIRRAILVVVLLAGVLAATHTASASAAGQTFHTTYYTINVTPATASQPALYLANAPGGGVNLQRYFSGAPGEQWVPIVDPAWPGVSPITGTSSVNDTVAGFIECIGHRACPFHVTTSAPRKFVNRLTGKCLTVAPNLTPHSFKTALTPCATSGSARAAQIFEWGFGEGEIRNGGVPRRPTQLVQSPNGQPRCANAANDTLYAPIVDNPCLATTSPVAWRQSFRFLEAASVTCTGRFAKVGVCGLPRG